MRSTIKRGSRGADVVVWQRVLGITADGAFGPQTESATKTWQATKGLVADGIVGAKSWAAATTASSPTPSQTFIQARNYRRGRRVPVRLVILHSMEAAEASTTAENVAKWFAGPSAPMASAHYCVDADSVVQCVREEDVAFAAPGANDDGIQIEMAGYARQTREEWQDAFSSAMLERVAGLCADLCRRHGLPVEYVDEDGLKSGAKGITTHAAVSRAFKRSTHTDPGKGFPMDEFLESVRAKLCAG